MEANTNSMYCKSNCGFFGNQACEGYCSKCYKDHVKRQNSGSATGRVTPSSLNMPTPSTQSHPEIPAPPTVQERAAQLSEQAAVQIDAILAAKPQTSMPPPSSTESVSSLATAQPSTPIAIPSKSNKSKEEDDAVSESMETGSLMASSLSSSVSGSEGGPTKKKNRCAFDVCKRKVGLTGFDCRCGGLFCWEHRYSDKHNCEFDYKELGQDQIRKANPIVVGEKIQKI